MSGPLGSQQWMYATETQPFYTYTIDNSCRFDNASYLYKEPMPAISVFTVSVWVKLSPVGDYDYIFSGNGGSLYWGLAYNKSGDANDGKFYIYILNGSGTTATTHVYRDYSAWYHLVFTRDGSGNFNLAVNGTTALSSVSLSEGIASGSAVRIGDFYTGSWHTHHFSGYMADFHFVDGTAYAPTDFAQYDTKTGTIWQPKAFTGAYGTSGFRLEFGNSADMGEDANGGSSLTPVGIVASDQMLDSPTNNCCTLNPLDPGTTGTLSEGNLVTSGNAKVTMRPTTGHWYYEKDGVGNTWDTSTSGEFNPTLTAGTYNFGQRPWADTGPTGDQAALCTQNLPDPTFDPAQGASPQDHFSVDLDADGSGALTAAQAVFPTGIWWLKNRTTTGNSDHLLVDSARGSTLELNPNAASAESTYSDPGGSSVSWSWKAASAVSGTTTGSGTLKSYSGYANATAGVSVITYEGNGTAGHQIPHHLATVPSVVIVKSRDEGTRNWIVYHAHTGASPETERMVLNGTSPKATVSPAWNSAVPSSSVVTLGNYYSVNNDTYDNTMYAFAEKDGFSKFGAYQGNSNADGPFVYLGFRPSFVMVKSTGGTTGKWCIFDDKRDGYNPDNDALHIYPTSSEDTADQIDLLSNGFKLRISNVDVNSSLYEYIYMAFAEQPFKYSTAR